MVDLEFLKPELGPDLDCSKILDLTATPETVKFVDSTGEPMQKERQVTICTASLGNSEDPCVIMVHGNGCGYLQFAPLGHLLVKHGLRVLHMDTRDIGNSTRYDDVLSDPISVASNNPEGLYAYDYEDCADDVIRVLDHYGYGGKDGYEQKVHILGFSSGGVIAQIAACKYPQRFQSLILMSTGLSMIEINERAAKQNPKFYEEFPACIMFHGEDDSLEKYVDDKTRFMECVIGYSPVGRADRAWHSSWKRITTSVATEIHKRGAVDYGLRGGIRMNLGRDHFERHKLSLHIENMRKLSTPVLQLHGTQDPMMLPEAGKELADMLPNCRTVWFTGPHWFGNHPCTLNLIVAAIVEHVTVTSLDLC